MGSVDYNDPLTLLLAAEENEQECDVLQSQYEAGCHVSHPQRDKDTDDMLGASPAELAAQDWLN